MIAEHDSRVFSQEDVPSLPSPRFDDTASAIAQPVEPIRSAPMSGWRSSLRNHFKRQFTSQSRALAIVILIGLVTGAVAGLLLVNASSTSGAVHETVTPSRESISEIPESETQKLDAYAAELNAAGNQTSAGRPITPRRSRLRAGVGRQRAYRMAVIR